MAEVVAEVAAVFVENLGHVHVRTCGKYISIFVLVSVICETKLKIEIFRRWIYMCTTDVCAPRVHMFLSTVLEQ